MCDSKCACENNLCSCVNRQCTYYNYPSYLNSKACVPKENYSTYKSYSGIGYKGKYQNPISYFSSFPYRYCKPNTTITSQSGSGSGSFSDYLKYDSCCCKYITCVNSSQSCPPLSPSFTINYALPSCPLDQLTSVNVFPIISAGTPLGGVWTLSQPGVPGVNVLFAIDSSTGELIIPQTQPAGSPFPGPESGTYTVTYTVCGYSIQWTADLGQC
jgi:hypothetical protein